MMLLRAARRMCAIMLRSQEDSLRLVTASGEGSAGYIFAQISAREQL
jgi:hypothetical protein